jgi:hypothetical protein
MSKKRKKVASLSGSLLAQDGKDSSSGFVISLVDRLKESQAAASPRSRQARRTGGKPAAGRPTEPAPSVDIADSIRPDRTEGGAEARKANRPGTARKPRKTAAPRPGPRPASADGLPAASLGEETAGGDAQHLVQALRQGEIERAEALFGRMTGLSVGSVRRVLYGAEGRNLAIACRALGIEQLQFVSIFMLSRRLGLGENALEPRQLTQIVGFFDQVSDASARQKLNQWLCYSVD